MLHLNILVKPAVITILLACQNQAFVPNGRIVIPQVGSKVAGRDSIFVINHTHKSSNLIHFASDVSVSDAEGPAKKGFLGKVSSLILLSKYLLLKTTLFLIILLSNAMT